MREIVRSVVLAVGLLFATIASANTMKEAADATFKLFDGERAVCSATYVGEDDGMDWFLTAAHCVKKVGTEYNIRITERDDQLKPLVETVHYVDVSRHIEKKDVALLKARVQLMTPPVPADIAEPGEIDLQIGHEMMAIGYPTGSILTLTSGEFTGKHPGILGIDGPLYRATPAVKGGSSGGGLWAKDGEEWKLVGTTLGMRRDSEFMNYFTTEEFVEDAVRFIK